jgi:hypothetical protein
MTKKELLERWRKARKDLVDSVRDLGQDEAGIANSIGKWSAKDVIVHIVHWDDEAVKGIEALLNGKRPPYLDEDWDKINAREVARASHKSLGEVLRDLEKSGNELRDLLYDIDEDEIFRSRGQKWRMFDITGDWIVSGNIEHDKHHTKKILAWRKTRLQ